MHQPVREGILTASGAIAAHSNHPMAARIAPFVPSLAEVMVRIDAGLAVAGDHPFAPIALRMCRKTIEAIQHRSPLGAIDQ
jgi:hypothetical protein